MARIGALTHAHLRAWFGTATGWLFVGALWGVAGVLFTVALGQGGEASLRAPVANFLPVLLFAVPVVSMRQLASARLRGVLDWMLSGPATEADVVVAAWCAGAVLFGLISGVFGVFAVVLRTIAEPDLGVQLCAIAMVWLVAVSLHAVGLAVSSVARDPIVAAVLGMAAGLMLWMAGPAAARAPLALRPWLEAVAMAPQLRALGRGVVDTGDLAWFAGLCAVGLWLAVRGLARRRWR